MKRSIHNLVQGTEAWHQFRFEHHGASEAAAMLGLSKTVTRTELLKAKATGIAKEFSEFVQTRILDRGHVLEALARPLVEALIEDELYPATYSYGQLSASCDGLTMDGTQAFEHKQWNEELAAAVSRGEVPEDHLPQCHQVLMVTGAERLIFVVSDGTLDKRVYAVVLPDQAWADRIFAGWNQFDEDVAKFEHVEVLPPAVADVRLGLPALSIQVNGQISLIDNLGVFGARLTEYIAAIDRNPSTDQAFADTEAAIKTLEKAQVALEAAEAGALAQTASIDEMRRTVAQFVEQARTTRLALEKILKARKDTIRIDIVQKGRSDFAAHIASLNQQIGRNYMPEVPTDFPGVIKSKRTITSLHDAVGTELARAKIAANEIAGRIQVNMATLRELASEYAFLFADTQQLVQKPNDDLKTLVNARIVEHKAAEQKRLDEERDRIRREEADKITREAEAKRATDEREAHERRAEEERRQQAERDRVAAEEKRERDAADAKGRAERDAKEDRTRQARRDQDEKDRAERQRRDDAERERLRAELRCTDLRETFKRLRAEVTGVDEFAWFAAAFDRHHAPKASRKKAAA